MHMNETLTAQTPESAGQRRSLWKSPAIITVLLLLIPLLGNYFVEDWHWRPGGFALVGALLFGICFSYQLMTRNIRAIAYRAAMVIALTATVLLCWGNLVQWADVNPVAEIYFGVPIVLVIGSIIARLRPNGMALALFATALVQASALFIVLIIMLIREPHVTFWTPPEMRGFGGNALNLMMFLTSGLLFRKAARQSALA